MAVPKKKASKSRTRRRRHINRVLRLPEVYRDKETGALVRRHHINPMNGMYRDNLLVAANVKEQGNAAPKAR